MAAVRSSGLILKMLSVSEPKMQGIVNTEQQ